MCYHALKLDHMPSQKPVHKRSNTSYEVSRLAEFTEAESRKEAARSRREVGKMEVSVRKMDGEGW